MDVLQGRGYTLLLILIGLPFCTPIPLPGLSTPFGLIIAIIGFRLALGKQPWLPRRILQTRIPAQFFPRLLGAARRLIKFLEWFLRPRWSALFKQSLITQGCGVAICVVGSLLLIPIPIPFSNGLPALTVVLLACAMLERDGYCLVAALVLFMLTLSFFAMLLWGGAELAGWLHNHMPGLFGPDKSPVR